jgi:tetratricopeptide (TPR) repeat protein
MAAEVALSTVLNQTPTSIGRARELLKSDSFNPWHTGELNGAMGTLAMRDRRIGKPVQFFRRSLRAPTENAIAQAQWFANVNAHFDVPSSSVSLQPSPEAEALKARAEERWLDAIQACHEWMMIDPTSTRPLIWGSFVASVALYDGTIALPFTTHWIRIAPDSSSAWNNHAVALVYANRMAEAKSAFKRVARQDSENFPDTVYLATKGLLAHRSGAIAEGRKLYEAAAASRRAQADPGLKALVWWHLVREEARIGTPNAKELIESAWTKSKALPIVELDAMKSTAEQVLRKALGSRIVATFQGREPARSFSIAKWE